MWYSIRYMTLERIKPLERQPTQSFLRERHLSTELLRKGPRTIEQKIAYIALCVCYGEADERNIYDDASRFSQPIEALWSEKTIYRPSNKTDVDKVYEYEPFSPKGQCFSNFAVGMVQVSSELFSKGYIDNVYWEEGSLWSATPKGEKKDELGDHHTWVRVVGGDGREWRIDLAAYQYIPQNPDPDGHIRLVMQGVGDHKTDPTISGVNWRMFNTRDDDPILVPNADSLLYQAEEVTPLKEYDSRRFKGRLQQLWGELDIDIPNYLGDMEKDVYLDDIGGESPGEFWEPVGWSKDDGQLYKPSELGVQPSQEAFPRVPLAEALQLVRNSNEDKVELSVEGLGVLVEQLVSQADLDTLVAWVANCAERALPLYEELFSDNNAARKAIETTRIWLQGKLQETSTLQEAYSQLSQQGNVPSRRMSQHALDAYWACRGAIDLAIDLSGIRPIPPEGDILTPPWLRPKSPQEFRASALRSAEHAGGAIDFSTFDRNVRPTPVSERHWQYLNLHSLLSKKKND